MSLLSEKSPTLTPLDRCDRCGVDSFGIGISQAYVKATLPSGLPLLFCAHHGSENIEKLRLLGAEIIDERDLLNK